MAHVKTLQPAGAQAPHLQPGKQSSLKGQRVLSLPLLFSKPPRETQASGKNGDGDWGAFGIFAAAPTCSRPLPQEMPPKWGFNCDPTELEMGPIYF